jgi:hypothetical protein
MPMDEANANAGLTLTPGPDGVLLLTTDRVSALQAGDEDGVAVFAADAIVIGAGEAMVVQAPDGRPVKVRTALLEVADGGRVAMEAHVELHADRAVFTGASPFRFVGEDGAPGPRGSDGERGRMELRWGAHGREGAKGGPGVPGEPGPGGRIYFGEIRGTLTVIAGGGNGGPGGDGGRGGDGVLGEADIVGPGGDGGPGGAGGDGGDGGTVLIVYGTLTPGATIIPVTKLAFGGMGGAGGGGGDPGSGWTDGGAPGRPGRTGAPGRPGAHGAVPVFLIRSDA